ncbi:MAG: hypothetical protein ACREA0_04080 [bacterium]
MDLSVSPDLAAYFCYGIVLLLGVFVAVVQIGERLGGMDGLWFIARTWLLFIAYVAVPFVLFWLLDRTGAITDTSLFAAVLIGVGYERIIAGGSQTLRAPGDVSALWTPFLAYTDKIAKVVLERGAQNQLRLAERIIAEIIEVPERYQALEAFASGRSSDIAALRAALADIDNAQASGESDKLEKKTRHLYGLILSIPDVHYLLKNKKIISDRFYWFQIKRMAQFFRLAVVVILVVGVSAKLAVTYDPDYREVTGTYHVWRLGKTNSSSVDQYRSRRRLVALMEYSPTVKEKATDQLIYLVQRPGLPMERVDLVLQTLLESRTRSPNRDLPPKLVQALRGGGLDARTRINDVLVFLASSCPGGIATELKDWKPTERDSSTTLEEKISGWNRYWTDACRPG